ncbi:MAG TPA: metalloregulator ArsR/SmtB family transcription factor [Gemmataceae bacterium]|nr:metalloregulator ArsR/SmtB family transcription factor [Gemmataceae bacterium]
MSNLPMRDRLQSAKCAQYLKALSEPDRLKIVQCLQTGPKNVSELAELLGEKLANVSHHLGILRHAGLVLKQKQGKYVVYDLHPDVYLNPERGVDAGVLNLGCCRLDLGKH